MKKTIMAVIATVLVMSALSAGADPAALTQVSTDRVLGRGLHLTHCIRQPNNAREWRRFSTCTSRNDDAVQQWGHRMDVCLAIYRVNERNDDAYSTADPLVLQTAPGLAPADLGGPAKFLMLWKQTAFCTA